MSLTFEAALGIAVVLWFATGWYLNTRLIAVHKKLDGLFDQFNGLREYLYEIDPQFDDERMSRDEFLSGNGGMFAGADDLELVLKKNQDGARTLNSSFSDGGFRAPNQ